MAETTYTDTMTAKIALSNLRGNLVKLRGERIEANRLADHNAVEAIDKQIAVTEYAIAAVSTFKASGKSALKAAAALPANA